MLEFILERVNYWIIIMLMMIGLYITFAAVNMIKRMIGLSIFQTSVFLFYISLSKVAGGSAPILIGDDLGGGYGAKDSHSGGDAAGHSAAEAAADVMLAAGGGTGERYAELVHTYSNPLPHVLILTAIVVGVATLSVGLAIIVRIREAYGTIEADEVRAIDIETAAAQEADVPDIPGEAPA
jgi:multicomponent Na+:H+ antiporter subunit C